MVTRLSFFITAVLMLGFAPSFASAQTSLLNIEVPPAPANLAVPQGNEVFLHGRAVGTQNYVCLPTATGIRWVFVAPQATLFVPVFGELQQQVTTHFLSPNPAEAGIARPTWMQSFDSSQVWGARPLHPPTPTMSRPTRSRGCWCRPLAERPDRPVARCSAAQLTFSA